MTDTEIETAINSAIEAVTARQNLKVAVELFVRHGDSALENLKRALLERPGELKPQEVQNLEELLNGELEWARSLKYVMDGHDRA